VKGAIMKKLTFYLIICFLTVKAAGQDIQLIADYPPVVTAGEQFPINFTVNSSGGEFTAPQFTNFMKLMGPQTSYSSSTQIINGKFSQQTSYTYTYYLQATTQGKFTLAPASIKIKGKEYLSDSIRISVISAGNTNASAGSRQGTTASGQQQGGGNDLFIRLILNKSEVYQGEALVATLKIYSRVDLSGLNEIKFPDFQGFLKENLETPPLTSLQKENVNGVVYGTGIIQQFLLYPQAAGDQVIGPVEISALIQQKVGNSDPFFGDFFSSYQNVPRGLATKPVTIKVKPLPGTKPADFSGLVGRVDLKASISRDSVNVNDALNYKIILSGSGNLKLAGKPELKMPPDVEVYEPKITDNLKNSAGGTTGQKTFEFVLIPRHYGSYTVPSVTYTYFDPDSKRYQTLNSGSFNFYARKGSDQGGGNVTVYGGVSKEDVQYLGKDIRFIESSPGKLAKSENYIVSGRSFLAFYTLALLIFIVVMVVRREHIRRNADITSVKNRKAARVAGKRLEEASKCLKSGLNDRFHEEILKALWGYLSDKLTIPLSELTRERAFEALQKKGISQEEITLLAGILDKCEFARYAPVKDVAEEEGIYEGAARFIRTVENSN